MAIPLFVEAAIESVVTVAPLAARLALDDVFRLLPLAEIPLMLLRQLPARPTNPPGEPHSFQELQSRQLLLGPYAGGVAVRLGLFVTYEARLVRLALQRAIDLSPLLFPDHALARAQDLGFKSRAQFLRHDFLASSSHAQLQVFSVDLQRPSVIANPSHEEMDMVVVGVVMIDCDPLKLGAEIALHLFDQATNVFLKIQSGCVLRRDDEAPEQVVVLFPVAHYRDHVDTVVVSIKALTLA
jgi:hypothetical protein